MGYIKISREALVHNFECFARLSGGAEKVIVGLKDNAYGHGIELGAKVLSELGAKHCFVRSLEEAKVVEQYFETVLLLGKAPKIALSEKFRSAALSLEILQQIPNNNAIELAIDTGMHRDGILPEELEMALQIIRERGLKLKGVFTHFAAADEDSGFLETQQKVFDACVANARKLWKEPFRVHCANTAATSIIDTSKYDATRIGLGIYGYSEAVKKVDLKPVLSLYAERISTRTLPKGVSVGYGSKAFIVPRDNFTVSTYNIGYGDGFLRLNENKKGCVADGRPILGRVSMDSFSLEGNDDEVCVFENVYHLAKVHQTIVYEILTSLKANIERILV